MRTVAQRYAKTYRAEVQFVADGLYSAAGLKSGAAGARRRRREIGIGSEVVGASRVGDPHHRVRAGTRDPLAGGDVRRGREQVAVLARTGRRTWRRVSAPARWGFGVGAEAGSRRIACLVF